jgi:hypothetical protein
MSETTPSTTFTHFLSKSRFIRGLQCHKALWLQTHRPELQDEVSASQQAVFDAGTSVGILAQGLYPGGIEVPYEGLSYEEQLAMTREEIQKGTSTRVSSKSFSTPCNSRWNKNHWFFYFYACKIHSCNLIQNQ